MFLDSFIRIMPSNLLDFATFMFLTLNLTFLLRPVRQLFLEQKSRAEQSLLLAAIVTLADLFATVDDEDVDDIAIAADGSSY